MKSYQGYLLDLDGTIYRGKELIPGAREFVQALRDASIPYLYVTNNSSASPERVAQKLNEMGLPASPEEVYTSSMATAAYLEQLQLKERSAYLIGEEGLQGELARIGFVLKEDHPACVVVGIDRSFHYDKLAKAANAVREGAIFIATNADPALPSEAGLRPGNGSLVAAVSVASGTKPVVIGKPEPWMVRFALEKLGTPAEQTLIVGDNLLTDIEAGHRSGLDSLLVLTGYSTREEAEKHPYPPTHIAEDLQDWLKRIS